MIHVGKGPCRQGHENDDIPLTGKTLQAEDGGTWWEVAPDQACGVCKQPLRWMYENPIVLELPVPIRASERVSS